MAMRSPYRTGRTIYKTVKSGRLSVSHAQYLVRQVPKNYRNPVGQRVRPK